MCGLFGWQFSKPLRRERLAVLAAVLQLRNDKRGGHSWGLYASEKGVTIKGIGNISSGISAVRLASYSAVLAHTRYATTGAVSSENAHPFHVGSVIGAHNGIVSNHKELNETYKRQCKVDSEHIFNHLNSNLPCDDISAYGAVEYVRTENRERVYLSRFNGGELAIAQLKNGIVWSSSARDLETALDLAGLKADFYQIDEDKLYFAERGEVFMSGALRFGEYRSTSKWQWEDEPKTARSGKHLADWYDLDICPDCFEELNSRGFCDMCGYYPYHDFEMEASNDHAD